MTDLEKEIISVSKKLDSARIQKEKYVKKVGVLYAELKSLQSKLKDNKKPITQKEKRREWFLKTYTNDDIDDLIDRIKSDPIIREFFIDKDYFGGKELLDSLNCFNIVEPLLTYNKSDIIKYLINTCSESHLYYKMLLGRFRMSLRC
jgi:hypothetical protein